MLTPMHRTITLDSEVLNGPLNSNLKSIRISKLVEQKPHDFSLEEEASVLDVWLTSIVPDQTPQTMNRHSTNSLKAGDFVLSIPKTN